MSRAGDDEIVVSVILPCRNTEFYLGAQLRALADQTLTEPWELVVCDNGSTDRSMAVADAFRSEFRRMTVVDASGLVGAGAVRNAGVRAARGDLLVFCDADDVVAPDWLAAMTDGLRKHPLVSAKLDHEKLNEPRLLSVRAPRVGLPNTQPAFMPYALGAALGVRREVHEAIGGFDESYTGAGEDRDYCYRAQLAGQDLVLLPEAVVHYRHRRSVCGVFSQSRAYGRARVQLYRSYRRFGMPRPSPMRSIGGWVLAPAKLPRALTARDRLLVWISRMGKRIGRLEGSIRYHVWGL
jgi:glycosyltransferase involved in cell wall biosynthesis